MLALALGYLLGGRLSTRTPSATIYGLFVGAALFALPIILLADSIMRPIMIYIEDARYGSLFALFSLSFLQAFWNDLPIFRQTNGRQESIVVIWLDCYTLFPLLGVL